MVAGEDGVGEIIETVMTPPTFIALRLGVIPAILDN
jgi:hypothetical protein